MHLLDHVMELQLNQELQKGMDHPTMDIQFCPVWFSYLSPSDQILEETVHLENYNAQTILEEKGKEI